MLLSRHRNRYLADPLVCLKRSSRRAVRRVSSEGLASSRHSRWDRQLQGRRLYLEAPPRLKELNKNHYLAVHLLNQLLLSRHRCLVKLSNLNRRPVSSVELVHLQLLRRRPRLACSGSRKGRQALQVCLEAAALLLSKVHKVEA